MNDAPVDPLEADRLFELTYEQLCRIARRSPYVTRSAQGTEAAALVNETYLRLRHRLRSLRVGDEPAERERFVLTMALAMRTVARDRWRSRNARRRGGGKTRVPLEDHEPVDPRAGSSSRAPDTLDLQQALERLRSHNTLWYDVLVSRHVDGRTTRETAERLGLSERAVKAHRRDGVAWLRRALSGT